MRLKLTLILLILNALHAEVILRKDTAYFAITESAANSIAKHPVQNTPARPWATPASAPKSSVTLKLDSDGIWKGSTNDILTKKISDHSLEGQMIDGNIPVYTWNTWGYQSRGGFSSTNTETLTQYQNGRLNEQIGILYQLFHNSPEAIVCLQELQQNNPNARTLILNALKALNISAEYLTQTKGASFGQIILYRKDRYKTVRAFKPHQPDNYSAGAAGRFTSTADPRQTGRVLKVYFEELTGKKRQLSVVNVHLAYQSPDLPGLIKELITYANGKAPHPVAVITGDFNHKINSYKGHNTDPKVTITQVGQSVVYGGSGPSTKQTQDNVDGFIIVQP